jgi:hypothetical protein
VGSGCNGKTVLSPGEKKLDHRALHYSMCGCEIGSPVNPCSLCHVLPMKLNTSSRNNTRQINNINEEVIKQIEKVITTEKNSYSKEEKEKKKKTNEERNQEV